MKIIEMVIDIRVVLTGRLFHDLFPTTRLLINLLVPPCEVGRTAFLYLAGKACSPLGAGGKPPDPHA